MALKKAQIVIEVQDKSLEELNKEIKDLQKNINQLQVGTEEWIKQNEKLGKLKNQFNDAKYAATDLQNVIKKTTVTTADQIRGIAKTGAGLVGTFTTISGSLRMIGIESEAFDEMTAKATTLMSIMGGLNQIAETFSSTNMKALRSIAGGFKNLVTVVRTASAGMKAALISTGVGALIVAVGMLIAKWDKLTALINRTGKKEIKLAEEKNKLTKIALTTQEAIYESYKKQYDLQLEKSKYDQSSMFLLKSELEMVQQKTIAAEIAKRAAETEIELIKAQKAQQDQQSRRARKSQTGITMTQAEYQYNLLAAEAKKDQLNAELQLSKMAEAEIRQKLKVVLLYDEINNEITKRQLELIKVSEKEDMLEQQYLLQRKILQDQYDLIIKIGERKAITERPSFSGLEFDPILTKEEKEQAEILKAQIEALDIQERQRKKKLADEIESIEYESRFNKELKNTLSTYGETINEINNYLNILQQNEIVLGDQYDIIANINKRYEAMMKARERISNYDKEGLIIFNKQYEKLFEELDVYNDIFEKTKDTLLNRIDVKKINEAVLTQLSEELALFTIQNEKKIEILENTKEQLEEERKLLIAEQDRINNLDIMFKNQLGIKTQLLESAKSELENARNTEQRKTALEKILTIENEIDEINENINNNIEDSINLTGELGEKDEEILKIHREISNINTEIEQKTNDVTAAIEEQSRQYQRILEFMDQYGEQIRIGAEILGQSLEFIATVFDSNATRIQDEINRLNAQYDMMNEKESERQSRLLQYEEELRDANGVRYDELLELIEKEKQAKDAAYISEKDQRNNILKLEHQRMVSERKAALWRKTQAIIDIITQTALAVINYASKVVTTPLIPWVVGLGAAQIATVAAQKIPEVPPLVQYKKGGYTGEGNDDDIAGITHANEYVVPAKVVRKPEAQKHIEILESMRNTGYKDGGFVSPSLSQDVTSQFDYDKFAEKLVEALRTLPNPVVGLVDIDQGLKSIHLTKKQASLTR